MKIIRVQKMIIGEETVATVVVIRLTKVAAMTIEDNVIVAVVTETEAETGGIGMMTSAKRPSDRPRMKKMMTEREAIKIIIIGMTGEIVIAIGMTGTDAEIAVTAVNGIGDTPGMSGRRIDTGTNVRATTRRGIARDRDRDRGTARHHCHSGRWVIGRKKDGTSWPSWKNWV